MEKQSLPGRFTYRRSLEERPLPAWEDDAASGEMDGPHHIDLAHASAGRAFTVEIEDSHGEREERFFMKVDDGEGPLKGWREVRLFDDELVVVPVELQMFEPNPYGSSFAMHSVLLQRGYNLGIIEPDVSPHEVIELGRMQRFSEEMTMPVEQREFQGSST